MSIKESCISVVHMDAKPIIDIAIGMNNLAELQFYKEILLNIGYYHVNGYKINNWYLFDKIYDDQEYHLHIMPYNSMRLFKQVLFKIFFEENEEYSHQYASLKRFYAENDDQVFYSMNKEPFVEKNKQSCN